LNIDILIEGVKKFLWNPSVKEGEEGGTPQIHKLVFGKEKKLISDCKRVDTPFMGGCLKYVFDILAKHVPGSTI